jgi:pimeloyl-ACP methyl ester carboxylesterase
VTPPGGGEQADGQRAAAPPPAGIGEQGARDGSGPPAPEAGNGGVARDDVQFFSGGERCAAWLYRPAGQGPDPCVVLGHGFGATRAGRLWAYAERFTAAGIAALVFDYRHFGDSDCEPRQLLDIGRQLEDWRSALVFVRSLEAIDPARVALWGTSFGGGHVVRVAAGDASVAAVVSQTPFATGISALREVGPAGCARLTAAGLVDAIGALRGREPRRIPIVGRPGELAAMTSPDALPGYQAMYEGAGYRNEFVPRVALRVGAYNPGWRAAKVRCPLLVCVAERDAVTPPRPAERMAARAPRGELVRYPIGHFDVYVGEGFERAVADQVEFLSRHLLDARVPAAAAAAR